MTMEKPVLVVGGAGYIGSHICKLLRQNGFSPVVLDDLSYGHRAAVRWGPLVSGNVGEQGVLDAVFSDRRFFGVMHMSAFTYVGESVTDPSRYYINNVSSTITLLDAMIRHGVPNFIFSSSCAIYGEPVRLPIDEAHPTAPISPYGRCKLMVEQILADYERAYGLKSVCLRYFNAAGADPDGEIGEDHRPETHLIPLVFQVALGQRDHIAIFGDDYPTADGTCVRDYIHVRDLAAAHLLGLNHLLDAGGSRQYNLGNGAGYSVREVIETVRRITGRDIPAKVEGRRDGDPPVLIGSAKRAATELGWLPAYGDLETIVETAWAWHRAHPNGYK